MMTILTTGLIIGLLGAICAIALALAAKAFEVQEDPRIALIEEALPGVNCGACGYAGCPDYAKAVASGDAPIDRCAPGGADVIARLAQLTGSEAVPDTEKVVAFVRCSGDEATAVHKHQYNGVADCFAANLVAGGDMLCENGCLGYGTCAAACPVNAIEIKDNLAIVHPDLCIGCSKCVSACPRDIISMVPASQSIHVQCNSKAKGPVAKKACQKPCIGCRLCVKMEPDAFEMDGFLARRIYSTHVTNPEVTDKCPGKCIVNYGDQEAPAEAGS